MARVDELIGDNARDEHGRFAPVRTAADVRALERMPLETMIPHRNVFEAIRCGVTSEPERAALHWLPRADPELEPLTTSHARLWQGIVQTANALHGLGVPPGTAIAVLMPTVPALYEIIGGALAAWIYAPVNWMLEPAAIAQIVRASGARVLIALGPTPGFEVWEKVEGLLPDLPQLDHVLRVDLSGDPAGPASLDPRVAALGPLRDPAAKQLQFDPAPSREDLAGYIHTGGTTGVPKLARVLHGAILHQLWNYGVCAAYEPGEVIFGCAPMFHIGGLYTGALMTLARSLTAVLPGPLGMREPGFVPSYWRFVDRYRMTRLVGSPTILGALLEIPVEGCDLSSLKPSISGGMALPAAVQEALERKTGVPMLPCYGLTEIGGVSLQPRQAEPRPGSSGVVLPHCRVKAVETDESGGFLRECAVDEIGLLVCRAPSMTPGYSDPAADRELFVEIAGERWLRSGDLGRIDPDGYLWVTGRSKDLIIRGGHNIDPRLIEEVLHSHPQIALAAAVGKPDSYAGELPVAYVQLQPGATLGEDELKDYVRARISERAAIPVDIHVIDEMPLTGVEKPFKPALRLDAARRVFSEALEPLRKREKIDFSISVDRDPRHGTLATVRVARTSPRGDVEEAVNALLDPFAIRHRIEWDGSPD